MKNDITEIVREFLTEDVTIFKKIYYCDKVERSNDYQSMIINRSFVLGVVLKFTSIGYNKENYGGLITLYDTDEDVEYHIKSLKTEPLVINNLILFCDVFAYYDVGDSNESGFIPVPIKLVNCTYSNNIEKSKYNIFENCESF